MERLAEIDAFRELPGVVTVALGMKESSDSRRQRISEQAGCLQ